MFRTENCKQPTSLSIGDTEIIPSNDSNVKENVLLTDDNGARTPTELSNQEPTDLVKRVMDDLMPKLCCECGRLIKEPFIIKVDDEFWHTGCLQCSVCNFRLDSRPSCYMKDDRLYCYEDYARYERH